MAIDTTAEYELALHEGDEYSAYLAAQLKSLKFATDYDREEMIVEEPDF